MMDYDINLIDKDRSFLSYMKDKFKLKGIRIGMDLPRITIFLLILKK